MGRLLEMVPHILFRKGAQKKRGQYRTLARVFQALRVNAMKGNQCNIIKFAGLALDTGVCRGKIKMIGVLRDHLPEVW